MREDAMGTASYKGIEQGTRLHTPDAQSPQKLTSPPTRRFLAFSIGRWVNKAAQEFDDWIVFQSELGMDNGVPEAEEDGSEKFTYSTRRERTTVVAPERIHTYHIYPRDAHQMILRAFADDRGAIRQFSKAKNRLRRLREQYALWIEQRNLRHQAQVLWDLDLLDRNPTRTLSEDCLDKDVLAMTNGIFELKPRLAAFGHGDVFGFVFGEAAQRFLRAERDESIEFITDKLGVRLDSDLELRMRNRLHHVSVLRKGIADDNPDQVIYKETEQAPFPAVLVTEFDPKMKVISAGNGTRRA